MTNSITMHNHHHADAMDIFGFWIYILSDCILFATIFSAYAVLHNNIYGNVSISALTDLQYVLIETIALLFSSFTYGLAILALYKNDRTKVMGWLIVTFLFGMLFVGMELNEFVNLVSSGHDWQMSAALSAFFTLVGTHGLHVSTGLLSMLVLIIQLYLFGINPMMKRRLTYLSIFWAFLDIIWIFVFTVVYLMGSI